MIDIEVLGPVLKTGAGFGIFAFSLFLCTSHGESHGFRVFPGSPRDWVGYLFRMLELVLVASVLLGFSRVVSPIVAAAFVASSFLLFASSITFWRTDRGLCICGFGFVILGVASMLFFPAVSLT